MDAPDLSSADSADCHPAMLDDETLLEECSLKGTRAHGPGGQHRNKVETAVEIVHIPTGTRVVAGERRSREQNRSAAVFRMRLELATAVRTVTSSFVEPSELWVSRCRSGKIVCSERHRDFPALLAEALNAVDAKDADVRTAAGALGCSTSQLVRFIARHPPALQWLNEQRRARGLRVLKA